MSNGNVVFTVQTDSSVNPPMMLGNSPVVPSGQIELKQEDEEVDLDNLDINQAPGNAMSAAMVEGVARYMEVTLQTFISAGVTNIMNAMGINETTMSLAKQMVNIVDNGMTLASSIITAVPTNIYMVPHGTSLTTAVCTSFRDMFDAMWTSTQEAYYTEWNNAITNLPSLEEVQHDIILMAIDAAMQLIDDYVYKYTGYHILELYYLVRHYIALYKQYREMKRQMASNGYNVEAGVNVNYDTKAVKQQLLNELNDCSDMIYNCFIIVQIKDAIDSIKEITAQLHDADLTTLTENINSFSDVMDLLIEMGLDDDSSQILSLSETIQSSINQFQSNAMQFLGRMGAQALQSGINITNAASDALSINSTLNVYQMYNFEADTENHALIMYVYDDPTTKTFKNALNITLSEKDEDGKQYMSNGNILTFLNTIIEAYNDDQKETEIDIDLTTYIIKFDIKEKEQFNKVSFSNNSSIIDDPNKNVNAEPSYSLGIVTEEYAEDPLAKRKRPTISLVHELFVIMKQFFPPLQILVVLISNYKINKEKVKNHAQGNLWGLARIIANLNKLDKKCNTNNVNFYTVRTLKMYDFICTGIAVPGAAADIQIDVPQTMKVYNWLKVNNLNYTSIKNNLPTTLYIDHEAINEQKKLLQDMKDNANNYFDNGDLFVDYPDTKYKDGDTMGLDKVEYIGDVVYYSDSSLPMYGSQIQIAYGKDLDPYS